MRIVSMLPGGKQDSEHYTTPNTHRLLDKSGTTVTIETNNDVLSITGDDITVNMGQNKGKIEVRGNGCLVRVEKNNGKIVLLGSGNSAQIAFESAHSKTVDEGTGNRIRLLSKAKPIKDDEVRPPKIKVEPLPVWSGHRKKFVGSGTRVGDGETIAPINGVPTRHDESEGSQEHSHSEQEPEPDEEPKHEGSDHGSNHNSEDNADEDEHVIPPDFPQHMIDDGFDPNLYMPFNGAYGGVTIGGDPVGAGGTAPTRQGQILSGTIVSADGRDVRIQKVHAAQNSVGSEFDCSICGIEASKAENDASYMDCKHSYHFSCVAEWLLRHSTCPMCKQQVGIVYRTVKPEE